MFVCFCCDQVGYMRESFRFFPKRFEDGYHPICLICEPYVVHSIKEWEKQKKLTDFGEEE